MSSRTVVVLAVLIVAGGSVFFMFRDGTQGTAAPQNGSNESPNGGSEDAEKTEAAARKRLADLTTPGQSRPSSALIEQFNTEDAGRAAKLVESQSDLTQSRGLVWAIGFKGDDRATPAIKSLLERDHEAKPLEDAQEQVIFESVQALGLAANRDKRAYDFVKQGTDPDFWTSRYTWKARRGDHTLSMLASYSIHAIGLSGRPEAKADIQELRTRNPYYLHKFAGDIVQAMYLEWIRETLGAEGLREFLLTPQNNNPLWQKWEASAEGAKAVAWANKATMGKRPAKPDK